MRCFALFFFFGLVMACGERSKEKLNSQHMDPLTLIERAQQLADKFIITDGHVDLPYRLNKHMEDISIATSRGDFDYIRAKKGGLDAPFMSIYVPSSYQETGGAKEFALEMIGLVERIVVDHPDKFGLASSPQDVENLFKRGLVALPMGMENGAPLEDDLANIQYFFDRGIRYITLTHAKDNLISDSSYDTTRTWNGLSPFGHNVVREMNRVGIMVDVSHISDSAFYQVMKVSETPVIASHSSCRSFTPGWERNMSDDMIKVLAEHGGVIQINFGSTFLDVQAKESNSDIEKSLAIWTEENKSLDEDSINAYKTQYHKKHFQFASVNHVVNHIDHVVSLVGINHVGLGSDFDGVGDTLPEGLKDVSQYPNVLAELLKRGYSEDDISKICYKNVFRVWNSTIKVASQLKQSS